MIQFTPEVPKKPGETLTLEMDFSGDLGVGETLVSATWVCTVLNGVDATPSAVISGAATVSGPKTFQQVVGGLEGVNYLETATVTSNLGNTFIGEGSLLVSSVVPPGPEMTLQGLIDLTRSLAGDPKYQGNSTAWTDDEIVAALNWAQTRYAELTHCTYKEVPSAGASDSNGVFTVPPGFILIDRVMIPEQNLSGPDATITAPSTAAHNASISASVPAQSGATFYWTVAGGTVTGGQGTRTLTFTTMDVVGGIATVSCIVTLGGLKDLQTVDVPLT
jgi:hypothetical protein